MKNPYHDPIESGELVLHPVRARWVIVFFAVFLWMPWARQLREIVAPVPEAAAASTLREKLRAFENHFASLPLFERWREADQERLVDWFREGNERVLIGKDGWLYYRADVETVTGKGPRYEEPPSVARDPSLGSWQKPLPVIRDFAGKLKERGIRLLLVPIPTKAMAYPEGLGASVSTALPTDYEDVLRELEGSDVEVVDLLPLLAKEGSYLKQDTHWTPATMRRAAETIARRIASPADTVPSEGMGRLTSVTRSHHGDLVGMLGEGSGKESFTPESALLEPVIETETGALLPFSPDASIVILGDSFVNIFEDPGLGFSEEGETRIGAGFASHLSRVLGESVELIASNGGGATTVRKSFAQSLATRESDPDTVIWVLSARDLFLAELPGRRAGIEWAAVELPGEKRRPPAPSGELVIRATLQERSRVGNPLQTPYESAIYSTIFSEIEVESGSLETEEALVFLWAFQKRKFLPTAHLETGKRYRLTLKPFPREGRAASAEQLDNFFRPELDRWFASAAELVE